MSGQPSPCSRSAMEAHAILQASCGCRYVLPETVLVERCGFHIQEAVAAIRRGGAVLKQ